MGLEAEPDGRCFYRYSCMTGSELAGPSILYLVETLEDAELTFLDR